MDNYGDALLTDPNWGGVKCKNLQYSPFQLAKFWNLLQNFTNFVRIFVHVYRVIAGLFKSGNNDSTNWFFISASL